MQFDAPLVLYVAPGIALAFLGLALWARASRVRHAARWSADLARAAAAANRWQAAAIAVAVLCVMAALAGPRWGRQIVTTDTQALDLVFAVDLSRSMLAEDADPSRLDRSRRELRRLVHDLQGDRLGLLGFAGRSFILSPLTIDGSALQLLIDALHPDLVSAGGSELGAALRQGRELLLASERLADRVLVVFTDGEAFDSLPQIAAAAEQLRHDGIRLILVAEGGTEPVRIPLRSVTGELEEYHRDVDDNIVLTERRDDILSAVADAAHGVLVAAGLGDQGGAVRDLVQAYKRAPDTSTSQASDVPRAWIPLSIAILVLLVATVTRRTAALAVILLAALGGSAGAQTPANAADAAWRRGDFARAASLYAQQARALDGGDTTVFNAGTAYLAVGRYDTARTFLERAAQSLDPDLRFRALYNLGLIGLRMAARDSAKRGEYLADARTRYREALLLRPGDADAKWNLELTVTDPPSGGDGSEGPAPPMPSGGGGDDPANPSPTALTREQAEQILESIAADERQTRLDQSRRRGQVKDGRRVKDW
ncbi:MAG TPA: vWA domain-containing protein [Gemmatimonadales bacterium]